MSTAQLRIVRKPCACGTPEPPHKCGWKLKAEFLIPASAVLEGDKLQFGLAFAPVLKVEIVNNGKSRKYTTTPSSVMITTSVGARSVGLTTPAMVRRVGLCGAACCDKCAREVDEHKHICRAHWDAWQQREALDQTLEAYDG